MSCVRAGFGSVPQLSSIIKDLFLHSINYSTGLILRLKVSYGKMAACNNIDYLLHYSHQASKN